MESAGVPNEPRFTPSELEAAIDRLSEEGSFAEAEALVARSAPGLQKVLDTALLAGGYFGSTHDSETLKAATTPDSDERITAVRTLLAEEARMGMMVGVAVGWALRGELSRAERVGDRASDDPTDGDPGPHRDDDLDPEES